MKVIHCHHLSESVDSVFYAKKNFVGKIFYSTYRCWYELTIFVLLVCPFEFGRQSVVLFVDMHVMFKSRKGSLNEP